MVFNFKDRDIRLETRVLMDINMNKIKVITSKNLFYKFLYIRTILLRKCENK